MSVAVRVTVSASTVKLVDDVASSSMNAFTWVVIRLSALDPAPETPRVNAPPATVTENPRTSASIVPTDSAVS